MSNWISNQLIVKGASTALAEFSKAAAGTIDGRRTPLSFEALLPTPPHLLANADLDAEGLCDLVLVDGQFSDTGSTGWYDWRCEHWGVKWELVEPPQLAHGPGMLRFWFDTAGRGPVALIAATAQRFPTLSFELVSTDQAWSYAGVAAFEGDEYRQLEDVGLDESLALEVLGRYWPEKAEQGLEIARSQQSGIKRRVLESVCCPGASTADALREAPHHVRAPATQELWSRRIES